MIKPDGGHSFFFEQRATAHKLLKISGFLGVVNLQAELELVSSQCVNMPLGMSARV